MPVIGSWTGGDADLLRQSLRMTNESFAEYLGVAVRTVAYWRKQPEITPMPAIQETLDAALERAPDRAKAQFALLAERGNRTGQHGFFRRYQIHAPSFLARHLRRLLREFPVSDCRPMT